MFLEFGLPAAVVYLKFVKFMGLKAIHVKPFQSYAETMYYTLSVKLGTRYQSIAMIKVNQFCNDNFAGIA